MDVKKTEINNKEALNEEFEASFNEDKKNNSISFKCAIDPSFESLIYFIYICEIKKGYEEMAKINLELSSEEFDNSITSYETWLSESDLSNDNANKKRGHLLC